MRNLIIFYLIFAAMPLFAQPEPQAQPKPYDFSVDEQFLSKCPVCPKKQEKKGVIVLLCNPKTISGYHEIITYQVVVREFETGKYYTKTTNNVDRSILGLTQFITFDNTWEQINVEPLVILDY